MCERFCNGATAYVTAGSDGGAFGRCLGGCDAVITVLECRFIIGNEGHFLMEFESILVCED